MLPFFGTPKKQNELGISSVGARILHNNLILQISILQSLSKLAIFWKSFFQICTVFQYLRDSFIRFKFSLLSRNWGQWMSVHPIAPQRASLIAQNGGSQQVAASPQNRAVAIGEGLTKQIGTLMMSHIHRLPIILSCFRLTTHYCMNLF